MAYIGKNGKTVGKKNRLSQVYQPLLNKNLVFAHKANAGDRSIDLTALNTPSELLANGFVQASTSDILGAKLGQSRGRLKLVSSLRGDLIDFFHYTVPSSSRIVFLPTAGFEQDEIITGTFESNSDMIPVSGKRIVKTYTVAVGDTVVNLGNEFKVAENILENIGQISVTINRQLALRNTGNSSTILDKDYYENDSGNGYGTSITLNAAPVVDPFEVVVDFGHRAITDQSSMGAIESLSGSMIKIAEDLAVLAGTAKEDYVTTSPSEVERRTFGDSVLDLVSRFDLSGTLSSLFNFYTKTKWQKKLLLANITNTGQTIVELGFSNLTVGKTYKLSLNIFATASGSEVFMEAYHNAINILSVGGTETLMYKGNNVIFTAVATSISVLHVTNGAGSRTLTATGGKTWSMLEELPNHELTNAWT